MAEAKNLLLLLLAVSLGNHEGTAFLGANWNSICTVCSFISDLCLLHQVTQTTYSFLYSLCQHCRALALGQLRQKTRATENRVLVQSSVPLLKQVRFLACNLVNFQLLLVFLCSLISLLYLFVICCPLSSLFLQLHMLFDR